MGRKKKTVLYNYKNKSGEEAIGSIRPKKARQVESLKEYARKRARRKAKPLPEEEKEKSKGGD